MAKVNDDSSYISRLIFAEIAKIKAHYKRLNYEAIEEFPITQEGNTTRYDLMVVRKDERIFFEVKSKQFPVDKLDMLQRRSLALRKFPNSEFRLVIVDEESTKHNVFIEGFDDFLLEVIKMKYMEELKNEYSNFEIAEAVLDISYKELNIGNVMGLFEGEAYLKAKFSANEPDFQGIYVDTIPFSFQAEIKSIDFYPYWSMSLFKYLKQSIAQIIESSEPIIKFRLSFQFYRYPPAHSDS